MAIRRLTVKALELDVAEKTTLDLPRIVLQSPFDKRIQTVHDNLATRGIVRCKDPIRKYLQKHSQTEQDRRSIHLTDMGAFPVVSYTCLQVPLGDFQDPTNVNMMHNRRSTGTRPWRNGKPRHDNVWVLAGEADRYGDMRGQKVGTSDCLLDMREIYSRRLFPVVCLNVYDPLDGGKLQGPEGVIRVIKVGKAKVYGVD